MPIHNTTSVLEHLDLSYNRNIGDRGAVYLMEALQHNTVIRAVLLKHVGVEDGGAVAIASLLRRRPYPAATGASRNFSRTGFQHGRVPGFYLNLNENRIGSMGTVVLGKGLPSYVSVTLCRQQYA